MFCREGDGEAGFFEDVEWQGGFRRVMAVVGHGDEYLDHSDRRCVELS